MEESYPQLHIIMIPKTDKPGICATIVSSNAAFKALPIEHQCTKQFSALFALCMEIGKSLVHLHNEKYSDSKTLNEYIKEMAESSTKGLDELVIKGAELEEAELTAKAMQVVANGFKNRKMADE